MKNLLKNIAFALLYPFTVAYAALTGLWHQLYDTGQKPGVQFDLAVISVGNLTVGGTGKTPMVAYMVQQLKQQTKPAILSRGYGRKTFGFRLATSSDTAYTIGDEPMQYFKQFGAEVVVAVGEKRAEAIPQLLAQYPEINTILLDDAFQHRQVKPGCQILLSDYHRPFYRDYVLPAGRLREPRKGAKRADIVVVTKCPEQLSDAQKQAIEAEIKQYAGQEKPVFFASIQYRAPIHLWSAKAVNIATRQWLLLTGIAQTAPLEQYLAVQKATVCTHLRYPDHHAFSEKDVKKIISTYQDYHRNKAETAILTTQKDAMRLLALQEPAMAEIPIYYLPIATVFLAGESAFWEEVKAKTGVSPA